MKIAIEHVAIYTLDLERLRVFYEKYFGAKSNDRYENASGFTSYFLSFDSGARLEIMAHPQCEYREPADKITGLAHLTFSVGSKEEVLSLTEKLVEDGYHLLGKPRQTGDGYFESVIADPDGNAIEITV